MVVGMERFGATGGASKASDNCSFAKISENNKDRCNGRSEQGKDALSVCAQSFKHGCLKSATLSRYARMHKDSHTKPLHDATAQMAVAAGRSDTDG